MSRPVLRNGDFNGIFSGFCSLTHSLWFHFPTGSRGHRPLVLLPEMPPMPQLLASGDRDQGRNSNFRQESLGLCGAWKCRVPILACSANELPKAKCSTSRFVAHSEYFIYIRQPMIDFPRTIAIVFVAIKEAPVKKISKCEAMSKSSIPVFLLYTHLIDDVTTVVL